MVGELFKKNDTITLIRRIMTNFDLLKNAKQLYFINIFF